MRVEGTALHTSADRELWHRKENRIELMGHAIVSQPGESLSADYVSIDATNRILVAKGNCIYLTSGNTIQGEEMRFNLDTRTGTIISGRVSSERFSLAGERLNKMGEARFQTHRGEYTTCRDCPGSWSLWAEDVDMEVGGYAQLSHVIGRVKDTPAFWIPYLVVPIKTRRQTGVLFPTFGFGASNGFMFVLPFYWAPHPSFDMTLGLGYFTQRGERFEWEGRYALSQRSRGTANFNYVRDATFLDSQGNKLSPNRWSLNVVQSHEFFPGFEEKLKLLEVSDNFYPYRVGDAARAGDVASFGDLNLASNLSLSYSNDDFSSTVSAMRYRTLINTDPDSVHQAKEFDTKTVQSLPVVGLTTRDRPFFGSPLVFGFNFNLANFTRQGAPFDYDYTQWPYGVVPTDQAPGYEAGVGVNPIRKATRVAMVPSLYTNYRILDGISLMPSVKYYSYFYSFPTVGGFSVPNLSRNYLLFQTDLSAQLERIYDTTIGNGPSKVKNLIRPMLTYSYIPSRLVREDTQHPFISQIQYATKNNIPGYYFDDYDIVPLNNSPATTNYFIPLGNSLALGVTAQWIRRATEATSGMSSYSRFIEAAAGETINFRELTSDAEHPQPLSRFFSSLSLNLPKFNYSHLYYYYPYIDGLRHSVSMNLNYALAQGIHQGIFSFDRSFGLSYNWDQHGLTDLTKGTNNITAQLNYSLSDYLMPALYASYFINNRRFQSAGVKLQLQSPSRCWRFSMSLPYRIENGLTWNVDLALNLTGGGFTGVSDAASQVGVVQ